jgi:uncharacterized protein (TIGR02145 family)
MAFWDGELKELGSLYNTFRGHLPDIVKELEQLIKTDDPNVVMLYSRRCLEVIITDLCENELKRPRKTEPLKGIIDKLNAEEKVPSHIITSMLSLNSMANYGAHPKDFDPEQVKPVLNNLAIIIKWYLKYKDFKIVSKNEPGEMEPEQEPSKIKPGNIEKPLSDNTKKKKVLPAVSTILGLLLVAYLVFHIFVQKNKVDSYIPEWPARALFTDSINNEIYTQIQIGDQVWMGENLRSEKFNDGTPIPLVKEADKWALTETPAFCWYENDRSKYKPTAYGALYNWHAVNTGKLCPAGWHVPADSEWTALELFADPGIDTAWFRKQVTGTKLKETGSRHWLLTDSIPGTDDFGFSALPAGNRNVYGPFFDIETAAGWWSSTGYDLDDAYSREIRERDSSFNFFNFKNYKKFGFSVRCIKDSKKN